MRRVWRGWAMRRAFSSPSRRSPTMSRSTAPGATAPSRNRCSDGSHVADVKALLAEVGKPGKGAAEAAPAPAKENVEELLWTMARSERLRPLVDLYLARYPSGAHVQEASGLLASLQQTQGS